MKTFGPNAGPTGESQGKGGLEGRYRSSILCLLLLCLFMLPGRLASAADQSAQNRLESIFAEKERGLELVRDFVRNLDADFRTKIPAARENLRQSKQRYHQLMFMLHISLNNPYEASLIFQDLAEVAGDVRAGIKPLIKLKNNLAVSAENIGQSLKELENVAELAKSPELAAGAKRMLVSSREILDKLNAARKEAAALITPTVEFAGEIDRRVAGLDRQLVEQWLFLFRETELSFFNPDLWRMAPALVSAWARHLPRLLIVRMPAVGDGGPAVLLGLAVAWLAVFLLGLRFLRGKYFSSMEGAESALKSMGRGWLLLSLAGALGVYTEWSVFPTDFLSDVISLLLTASGCLVLGLGIRRLQFPSLTVSPFTPLFWVYAPCMGFLFLALPLGVMTLVVPLLLLAALRPLYRRSKMELPPLENWLAKASLWGVSTLCLLAAWGLAYLSLYLLSAWLLTSALVQIVEGLLHHLKSAGWAEEKSAVRALLYSLLTPLARIFLLVAVAMWLAHQLGGLHLLARLAETKIQFKWLNFSLQQVITVVFLFFVVRVLVSASQDFWGRMATWARLEQGTSTSLQVVFSYGLWGLYIILVLYLLGANFTSLLVVAGGLSVGIGFGLQNIVNNFISGLILLFGNSLHQGDVIEINGIFCLVLKINIRTTVVQTMDNALIMVPNSEMISGRLTNWTRNGAKVRRQMKVGVAYGSDVAKVKKLLLEVAAAHPKVLERPRPMVLFWGFRGQQPGFRAPGLGGTQPRQSDPFRPARGGTVRAFAENGVEIALPKLDLCLKDLPAENGEAAET